MRRVGGPMRAVAVAMIVAIVAVGCSGGSTDENGRPSVRHVVVDTDMGSDDVMALLYLLQRPDVDILAVTVTGTGLVHCEAGVANALAVLALAGRRDIPVACGREEPLTGYNTFPTSWRLAADDLYGLDLPAGPSAASPGDAVDVLAAAVESSPQKVDVLTLGPLTNVAQAVEEHPDVMGNVRVIYTMGGAVEARGNIIKNEVAEWNIWVDPHAANVVFGSGIPVALVPLDATNHVPITRFFYDVLAEHHSSPEATFVYDLLTKNSFVLEGQFFFWDPVAAAILTEEDLATFETRQLWVIEEGDREVLGRVEESPKGADVRMAVDVDDLAFERRYLNTLNGAGDVGATRPEADITVTFDGRDCSYRGPRNVAAGQLIVYTENRGAVEFGVGAARILAGRDFEDFEDLVTLFDTGEAEGEPPSWVEPVGWASALPADGQTAAWELGPGDFGLACFTDEGQHVWALAPLTVMTDPGAGS